MISKAHGRASTIHYHTYTFWNAATRGVTSSALNAEEGRLVVKHLLVLIESSLSTQDKA